MPLETIMDHVIALKDQVADIQQHTIVMNTEMSEVRDEQKNQRGVLVAMQIKMARVEENTNWLMRFFWIVATAAVGSLIVGFLNFLAK